MGNISDIIEAFILETLGDDDMLSISRNDLAEFFNCAPSQINYVLSTRFGSDRGFLTESQRGGGGYIKLIRMKYDDNVKDVLFDKIGDSISYKSASYLLQDLISQGYITEEQAKIVTYCIAPRSLMTPIKIDDKVRSNIMKNALMNIIKDNGGK